MKQLFILLSCVFLLASCFEQTPLEPAQNIPIDSISHYYSIEFNEADSTIHITFSSWPILNRDKRLLIPDVDNVKINEQILKLENNSYKLNIPIQKVKNDIITISYFKSDTVFYEKRIKLARFYSCKVNFIQDSDVGVFFEPALNTFEELDVELKGAKTIRKRFDYNENIKNGITFKKNLGLNYGIKNTTIPIIRLKKLYAEKYTEPMHIEIRTSTEIERKIEDVSVIPVE